MPRYWLDASVLIEAHHRTHPVKMAVSFWAWMASQVQQGNLVCPKRVYQEIAEVDSHKDDLALWVKNRKDKGLCVKPSKTVQGFVGKIEEHVFKKYNAVEAMDFSKGADPWVIAHALDDGGVVVTNESFLRPNAQKARIPDVCHEFNVKCVDTLEMLTLLKARY